MEGPANTHLTPEPNGAAACGDKRNPLPFSQQRVTITKQEYIKLRHRANYWEAQHARAKEKIEALEQEIILKDAKIKDLQNRLFGKKSEKGATAKSEKDNSSFESRRSRGQQPGSRGHGPTNRAHLPVVQDEKDLAEDEKSCPNCGLPYLRNSALDEQNDVIEVEVRAHIRRYIRPAYTPNPGCNCADTPAIITAPPPPRLIPGSNYGVSFWVEVILGKYRYGQPTNRHLQDLSDQGLPVSPGTVAGGLQRLASLFEPVLEALYCKQMSEQLFHNDETRWEVFVQIEGKVGTRWYLWVTRSQSVVFYCIDPSRSAAVPGAHFAGLQQQDKAIIVCDRYSAYKKLARLADNLLLAFCWAHVRRDFLDTARSFPELEGWALVCKERIGTLYHLNRLRLEYWEPERPLTQQPDAFNQHHKALLNALQLMHEDATRIVAPDTTELENKADAEIEGSRCVPVAPLSKSAQAQQKKVCQSLLDHWSGLTLFVEHPEVPMDNNRAENIIRNPVTGRKNYYGSASLWSAELAATQFSILQTLVVWCINTRHWLTRYLNACAENGGKAPQNIDPFLPWLMDDERQAEFARPYPSQAHPAPPIESVPILDSS